MPRLDSVIASHGWRFLRHNELRSIRLRRMVAQLVVWSKRIDRALNFVGVTNGWPLQILFECCGFEKHGTGYKRF